MDENDIPGGTPLPAEVTDAINTEQAGGEAPPPERPTLPLHPLLANNFKIGMHVNLFGGRFVVTEMAGVGMLLLLDGVTRTTEKKIRLQRRATAREARRVAKLEKADAKKRAKRRGETKEETLPAAA